MHLLHGHVNFNKILITPWAAYPVLSTIKSNTSPETVMHSLECLPISHVKLVHLSTIDQLAEHITMKNVPVQFGGPLAFDQQQWKEFYRSIEPFQDQCLIVGRRLVQVLNDIRSLDAQGKPTRRQLHSQHRALSRALMDSELQSLRRKGANTIKKLQDHSNRIRKFKITPSYSISNKTKIIKTESTPAESLIDEDSIKYNKSHVNSLRNGKSTEVHNSNASNSEPIKQTDFVQQRLNEVITVFHEVDRAAKRLEQLTEQRRERLRELTRQRALEDEINEVCNNIFARNYSIIHNILNS